MGAGARRNPPPLHERIRDLGRVDIGYVERHNRRARLLVKGTVELNPRNLAHTGKEAISERTLVGSNRLDPTLGLDKSRPAESPAMP